MRRSHRLTAVALRVSFAIVAVTLTLCRSGHDNTAAETFTITPSPGQFVASIGDVVDNATNDPYFVRGIKTMEFPAP
ncbi:MAG: hypothetical protein C3F15_15635 [Holophagae bacterium]|nr:MAG: hypothetical protein C3F15_15635 [Holophagae bacterium]